MKLLLQLLGGNGLVGVSQLVFVAQLNVGLAGCYSQLPGFLALKKFTDVISKLCYYSSDSWYSYSKKGLSQMLSR